MKFCSECGSDQLTRRVPPDDTLERDVCAACGAIHYRNPKIVAGALLTWEGRILMAKRNIEPRSGFWTLPAGFMENGETIAQAAARECLEEALATAEDLTLYAIYSLPDISQVYVMYRGIVAGGHYGVGVESQAVDLLTPEQIPWGELAFPIVMRTLERYLEDAPEGRFPVLEETLGPPDWRRMKRALSQ